MLAIAEGGDVGLSKRRDIARFRQFAALPYAITAGHIEVCLVTSRDTQRWIIPKGWAERKLAPHKLAAREALEEAGLVGKIAKKPVGEYTYVKDGKVSCRVAVFPMLVRQQLESWQESAERTRTWVASSVAADLVEEPELAALLANLDDLIAR